LSTTERNTYTFKRNDERDVERFVGIEIYATSKIKGIGGEYKKQFKDFIVKEITHNGKTLSIKEDYKSPPFSRALKDHYTTFNLVKVNRDTFEAMRLIRADLNIPYNWINYSGLKDKFSISVQKISVKGNYIEKLNRVKIKNIFIRNIQPSKKPVRLGSHKGNNFVIFLRNIENIRNLQEKITGYISFLNEFGFPNYFGLQRFGKYRPNSHIVGRHLIEGNFKQAFKEFVSTTYSTESPESNHVRREFNNDGNLEKAYNNFPKSLKYEKNMIHHLIENQDDYSGSLNTLPSSLKRLLVSAFQSFLFNKMLTLRVMKGFSLFKPIKGDKISILDDYNGDVTRALYIYGDKYDETIDKALDLNRAVIVFPIIGYNTNFDEFPLANKWLKEIFKQLGLNKKFFSSEFLNEPEFKGSMRAITSKPIGLKLLKIYDDELYPGRKKAKLEFSLLKGRYATMLIRELIK